MLSKLNWGAPKSVTGDGGVTDANVVTALPNMC
jgi:hypothetical protein